jgi:lipopolysaccharide/colanic/teichoic acid biosynthesis glycosyltransferase
MAHSVINEDVIPAVDVKDTAYLRSRTKRTIDIGTSLIGILVFFAVFLIVAVFIKLDSRGSVLYRQKRLGIDGRHFYLIKFRTMKSNAEEYGEAIWASQNDPRSTRVGRFLRKAYIDELPQWWNVLRGDMSVVGPRPERPELNYVIVQKYPQFLGRLSAKPGITGLAQTEYKYVASIDDSRHKYSYDLLYLANASVTLDIWIFIRTFRRMILRRGT